MHIDKQKRLTRDDAQYMMQRCVLLLLSDVRPNKPGESETLFKPVPDRDSKQKALPRLAPLVLLLNLWVALRALSTTILPRCKSMPFTWGPEIEVVKPGATMHGRIDWSRTFKQWATGERLFYVKNRRRRTQKEHVVYIAKVFIETDIHCNRIVEVIQSISGIENQPVLLEILEAVGEIRKAVRETLNRHFHPLLDSARKWRRKVDFYFLRMLKECETDIRTSIGSYAVNVDLRPPTGSFVTEVVENLCAWREQYLSCAVWILGGTGFKVQQRQHVSRLYEMWVFIELVFTIQRACIGEAIQRCFISRNRVSPEFSIGDDYYAYFDSRKSVFKTVDAEVALQGGSGSALAKVFVEWFIRDKNDYRESVILDTKYSDWRSGETLKMMGYMLNFGVRKGAVIFGGEVPEPELGGRVVVPGLVKVVCPTDVPVSVWVLSLVPGESWKEQNESVLDAFVADAFPGGPI